MNREQVIKIAQDAVHFRNIGMPERPVSNEEHAELARHFLEIVPQTTEPEVVEESERWVPSETETRPSA